MENTQLNEVITLAQTYLKDQVAQMQAQINSLSAYCTTLSNFVNNNDEYVIPITHDENMLYQVKINKSDKNKTLIDSISIVDDNETNIILDNTNIKDEHIKNLLKNYKNFLETTTVNDLLDQQTHIAFFNGLQYAVIYSTNDTDNKNGE